MTLGEASAILEKGGIDSSRWEAGLLIEYFCGVSRAAMLADPLRNYENTELFAAIEKRAARYPLQYILGTWEFCGLEFTVDERCLIPRPDTEVIVEAAVSELGLSSGKKFLDLCTGSGCIAAAILSQCSNSSGVAVELDPATASLARDNLSRLGFSDRCPVIVGDAAVDLFSDCEKFDVIVSNPPYISEDEMSALEPELSFEPRIALTDGADGLSLIRQIVSVYLTHLSDGGAIIIEHGWKQSSALCEIAREHSLSHTPIYDYSGNIRGALMKRL